MNIRSLGCFSVCLFLLASVSVVALAQGVAPPLNLQGLDVVSTQSARARAMGGTLFGTTRSSQDLFGNPSGLVGIPAMEVRLGATLGIRDNSMEQRWYVNDHVDMFSMIVENKPEYGPIFDSINDKFRNDPAQSYRYGRLFNVKPLDNMGTDWSKTLSRVGPSLAAAAVPFQLGSFRFAAGLGYAEMINLDHYFQNNTVLAPNIGSFRPAPVPVFKKVGDTMAVRLYQYVTERKGSVYGITPGFAIELLEGLTAGLSVTLFTGSSDDRVERHDRAEIVLRTLTTSVAINPMPQVDSVLYHGVSTGSSEFDGTMLKIGLTYQKKFFSLGVVMTPAYTITREWSMTTSVEQRNAQKAIVRESIPTSGKDDIRYPVAFGFGLVLYPNNNVTIAVDYDDRGLGDVTYAQPTGAESKPWFASKRYRMGFEYLVSEGVALRGGYREDPQVFAGEGAAQPTVVERARVYTGGFGISLGIVSVDLSYELSHLKFFDTWLSNTNFTTRYAHSIGVEATYRF
ncbi:MAG: hypothetical protein FJ215_07455 [Ignavibacteria bacterium]|nr:hypothetical protein [Ignavibacteria bacterium]